MAIDSASIALVTLECVREAPRRTTEAGAKTDRCATTDDNMAARVSATIPPPQQPTAEYRADTTPSNTTTRHLGLTPSLHARVKIRAAFYAEGMRRAWQPGYRSQIKAR